RDIIGTLGHWELYALVALGGLSMVVAQSAFQAGNLRQSLPALTLVPPLVSLPIGRWVFGERLHASGPVAVLAGACAVVAAAGVVSLGRSPLAEAAYAAAPVPAGD